MCSQMSPLGFRGLRPFTLFFVLYGIEFSHCASTWEPTKHGVKPHVAGTPADTSTTAFEAAAFLQRGVAYSRFLGQLSNPTPRRNVLLTGLDTGLQPRASSAKGVTGQNIPDFLAPVRRPRTASAPAGASRQYPMLALLRGGAPEALPGGGKSPPGSPGPGTPKAPEWIDMSAIPRVHEDRLRKGKKNLVRLVKQLVPDIGQAEMSSFLERATGFRRYPLLDRRAPHDDNAADHEIWQIGAVEKWARPHRFRESPFSGALSSFPDTHGSALSPTSFVESAKAGVARWTIKIGWEKAMESAWPKGEPIVATDGAGNKFNLIRKKTLGMGSFGAVVLVESPEAPAREWARRFAVKIPYTFRSNCDEECWAQLKQMANDEDETRQLLLMAGRKVKTLSPGASDDEILAFLDKQGVLCPLDFLRILSTPTVSDAPSTSERFEVPSDVIESPDGTSLYFMNHLTGFHALGPDLHHLPPAQLNMDTRAYMVYALVRLLAKFHSLALTHNDLKPENVLIHPTGKMYLTDLTMMQRASPGVQVPCGNCTPLYLDPQTATCAVVDSRRPPDFARDGWALGVILFQVLCDGMMPYKLAQLSLQSDDILASGHPDAPREAAAMLYKAIAPFRRSDWHERRCRNHGGLLNIAKALLDIERRDRWTPLKLVEKVSFFRDVEGLDVP
ncbi:rhoptry kinase family protein rop28 [Cystoisospora suis]|uniref:non-specific serine/threonine protein kinase n=1 Tax=Cystoisospora suis TaxID=483139 RepID=A0A2C6L3C6_9APIC|nr:rhoptry kinase family protein rop28 [Cystoisospora suis]